MKVSGFACDQCEKFSEDQDGWYTIHNSEGSEVEVCSLQCVRNFANQALRVIGTPPPGQPPKDENPAQYGAQHTSNGHAPTIRTLAQADILGKVTCRVCGTPVSESYLGTHLRKMHGIRGGKSSKPRDTHNMSKKTAGIH